MGISERGLRPAVQYLSDQPSDYREATAFDRPPRCGADAPREELFLVRLRGLSKEPDQLRVLPRESLQFLSLELQVAQVALELLDPNPVAVLCNQEQVTVREVIDGLDDRHRPRLGVLGLATEFGF